MPARAPRTAQPTQLDLRRPFLRAEALKAGLTDKVLAGPRFRRIFTGVFIAADVAPHPLHRVAAALLVHPATAFASHVSAARVLNAPLPVGLVDEHVSVFGAGDRRRRNGIRPHVVPPGTPVARWNDLRISAPVQNFVELAEQLDLVDLVVVGDHYVRRGWVTSEDLVAHADRAGNAHARRAARCVRRDVDSPMETRLRMLLVLAGLPEPVVNHKLVTEGGSVRYRFDLRWPEVKVAVEYDGRQHRADLDQWDHDLERDEWLVEAGWTRVVVVARGIYRRPDETLARVVKALRRRGCSSVPRRLSEEWRPYFPVTR